MSKRNDGGSAFPSYDCQNGMIASVPTNGMTLRDYFAAKALAGMLVMWKPEVSNLATAEMGAAIAAYRLADAMLAERGSLTEYERGRLAIRRELNAAVRRFNADDTKGIGQLIEYIDQFLLTDDEERAEAAEKVGS